jgi:predicted GNAT family acetyltransferase
MPVISDGAPCAPIFSLRQVHKEDLATLLTHRNHASTRRWLEHDDLITEAQQHFWFQNGGAKVVRIIERDGVGVGLARIDSATGNESIVGLDLFPEFRGMGYGAPCFRVICSEAAAGGRALSLWVFRDNVAAVAIYKTAGFVEDAQAVVKWLPRALVSTNPATQFAYVKMIKTP